MILNLVKNTDPILKKPAERFDFDNPQMDPIQLAKDLAETMMHNNGFGLAAPQVGIPLQAFVLLANPIIAVFNPKLVSTGIERDTME